MVSKCRSGKGPVQQPQSLTRGRILIQRNGCFGHGIASGRRHPIAVLINHPLTVFLNELTALRRQQVQNFLRRSAELHALGADDHGPIDQDRMYPSWHRAIVRHSASDRRGQARHRACPFSRSRARTSLPMRAMSWVNIAQEGVVVQGSGCFQRGSNGRNCRCIGRGR